MGLYAKYVFPRILDWSLKAPQVREERRRALALAKGDVLEIGFGTGLNLPYFPATVASLSALDSADMLSARVARRIQRSGLRVNRFLLDASGRLPFGDESFDTVVTTFTLCSIKDVSPAMSEIRRVLKPDGLFLFLEHGRSDDLKTAKSQDRFNPIQNIIAAGCNINRQIDQIILEGDFQITALDRFELADTPRIMAPMYRGVARRSDHVPGNLSAS